MSVVSLSLQRARIRAGLNLRRENDTVEKMAAGEVRKWKRWVEWRAEERKAEDAERRRIAIEGSRDRGSEGARAFDVEETIVAP